MDKMYAKKLAGVALLSLASVSAFAQADGTACAGTGGTTAINGGKGATNPSATNFFQMGFDVQCSQNTFVYYSEQSASLFAVAGASAKGNGVFVASTAGGSPKQDTAIKCSGPNESCLAADAKTGLDNAKKIGNP